MYIVLVYIFLVTVIKCKYHLSVWRSHDAMCYDHLCNLEVTWYVLGIPGSSHGDHVAEGGCSEHTSRWYVMRSNEEFPVAGTR